jgi:hypothetical protein
MTKGWARLNPISNKVPSLLKLVQYREDKLSEAVTLLWKAVNPTPDEIEAASDVLREHEDNWNPTDLDILRNILKEDRDNGKV